MKINFDKADGSTRVSRVVSGVAPETPCGAQLSGRVAGFSTAHAPRQFGETPNWTRGTRVLPKFYGAESGAWLN
jgi:hypothetical protein